LAKSVLEPPEVREWNSTFTRIERERITNALFVSKPSRFSARNVEIIDYRSEQSTVPPRCMG